MAVTTPVVTRRDLDPLKCGTKGCGCAGPLFLTPKCHPNHALTVEYDWTTGRLRIACATCELHVCTIAVAP